MLKLADVLILTIPWAAKTKSGVANIKCGYGKSKGTKPLPTPVQRTSE